MRLLRNFSLMLLIIFTASCSEEQKDTTEKKEPRRSESQTVLKQGTADIEITDAWIRSAAKGMNTAFFFKVTNKGNETDHLLGASSKIAGAAEVHETYTTDDGRMGMREVESIGIEEGTTIEFKPRFYHVMLIKINNDFLNGEEYEVVLEFENAGKILVKAEVKDMTKM